MHKSKRNAQLNALLCFSPKIVSLDNTGVSYHEPDGQGLPPRFEAQGQELLLDAWANHEQQSIDRILNRYGAVLFRGFKVRSADGFGAFVEGLDDELLEYLDRSSPRHEVADRIYTSTDYPNQETINMHNELSYSHDWPLRLAFYCEVAAPQGGQTPWADSRGVLAALRPETRAVFAEKGVGYVRNLVDGIGLSWRDAFATDNPEEVEAHCRQAGIRWHWRDGNWLRLEWERPAIRRHPVSGEQVWFNHAYFYHTAILDPALQEVFTAEEIPFTSRYGDGQAIPDRVAVEIGQAIASQRRLFQWQKGDVLLLDNMLCAHGREPFTGPRKVLVSMCRPYSRYQAGRRQ